MNAKKRKPERRSSDSATKDRAKSRLKTAKTWVETSLSAVEYFQQLDNLQREARVRFEAFVDVNRNLPCIQRSEEWLKFVLSEDPIAFGDQEAAIYLTSRGKDCGTAIQKINDQWIDHEQRMIQKCSAGSATSIVRLDGRTRHVGQTRHVGGMSLFEARKIEERSEFQLPNFWWGSRHQEQSLDATMLRTAEWCGIGGFEPWWKRLARRTTEDFVEGGIESGSLVYWIFAMSRSELAIKMMPKALKLALDNIELVRTGSRPWTHWEPNARHPEKPNEYVYEEFEDLAYASALLFANYRLRASNERTEDLLGAAAGLLQKHQRIGGSWPYFSHDKESSIEATAMAIHALALNRPAGWERNVGQAVSTLKGSQEESGCWAEKSCPDAAYLTVLVLDALELANDGNRTTIGRLPSATNPHRPEPNAMAQTFENHSARRESIFQMVQNPQGKKTLSTSQVVDYFEVSARTIYRWVAKGKLSWGGRRGSITIESIQGLERKRSRKRSVS